jgi:DNA-binding response OmpR family regulator
MMPELDGFQLCKALKEAPETMGIPFILLTARADMEGKLTGLRAGADDYVIKPFHLEEVKARLRAQLRMASLAEAVSQRERLASLGVLVAGVAHEIRTASSTLCNR